MYFLRKKEKTIETSLFDNFQVRNIGPAKVSGRITKVIKDYSNTSTWYVSTASGNVWKTKNSELHGFQFLKIMVVIQLVQLPWIQKSKYFMARNR